MLTDEIWETVQPAMSISTGVDIPCLSANSNPNPMISVLLRALNWLLIPKLYT